MSKNHFTKRTACPVCSTTTFKTLFSCEYLESPIKDHLEVLFAPVGYYETNYLENAVYTLVECPNCSLIYQQAIPDDFLSQKIYSEWIDAQKTFENHERSDDLAQYAQYAQEIMMMVAYFQAIPSQLKFFDFGMGWGKWSRMARAFGCESYGTEVSEARIEFARSHGIKVITWDEIPDYRFDFINANQVFEHLPEPLETLRYLKQALQPKGVIKICVPDGSNVKNLLKIAEWTAPLGAKNSLSSVSPLVHINCFNYHSLTKLADLAGLEQVKVPITVQFLSSTNWQPLKPMLKNIFRPIYRNFLQKSTYLLFRKKKS